MNLDLKHNEICLTSSPVTYFTGGLTDTQTKSVSFPVAPSLEEMLDQIGPFPRMALFLGQADDELPVLLDLSNPRPGPVLISGEAGAGKTRLLRVIAQFIVSTRLPQEIQYGVITPCPHEWSDLADAPHCVGVFPVGAKSTSDFLHALALWAQVEKTHRQYVLLLIDGLDALISQNNLGAYELGRLLSEGPANRIWPIATIRPSCNAGDWLKYFHTRVWGENSSGETEFILKERSPQIKFRLPRV